MKRMKLAASFACLFFIVLSLAATAQEPPQPGPPPPLQLVARFLQLTQDQVQQFETLLRQREETVRSISEQIRTRGQRLESMLNSSNPDPAAVGALVLEIHGLSRQVRQAQENFMTALNNLLTQDQRDRVTAVQRASRLLPVIEAFARLGLLPPPPEARSQQFSLPLGIPPELFQPQEQ